MIATDARPRLRWGGDFWGFLLQRPQGITRVSDPPVPLRSKDFAVFLIFRCESRNGMASHAAPKESP